MTWIKIKGLDANKSFKARPHSHIRDWKIKDGVVWFQNRKKMAKADPETLEAWDDDSLSFIVRDKQHVFDGSQLMTKIDRDTMRSCGGGYWTDQNNAYCEHETSIKPLKGGDPEHFKYIGGPYARDSKFAYYAGRVLKNCQSPMKLELINSDQVYAGDGELIYYDGAELKGVDADTWEHITGGYSRDKKTIYFGNKKLPSVKPENWKLLRNNYSCDDKHVYRMCFNVKDADPKTFVPPNR